MLTIIIPVYNSKPFIRRCLDSIPDADGIEVIVVDDGSTDGSAAICERYPFAVLHTPHHGVAHARNTGIEAAHGDRLTFLDSDDEYLPGAVEAMLSDSAHRLVQYNHMIAKGCDRYPRMTSRAGVYTLDHRPRAWWGVWNKVFARDVIGGVRFEDGLQYGEDAIFALRCIMRAGAFYHSETATVLKHTDNRRSLTRTVSPEMHMAYRRELDRLLDRADPESRRIMEKAIGELNI